jgi:hypothetical protein
VPGLALNLNSSDLHLLGSWNCGYHHIQYKTVLQKPDKNREKGENR